MSVKSNEIPWHFEDNKSAVPTELLILLSLLITGLKPGAIISFAPMELVLNLICKRQHEVVFLNVFEKKIGDYH
jgi:hypothetical protein